MMEGAHILHPFPFRRSQFTGFLMKNKDKAVQLKVKQLKLGLKLCLFKDKNSL